MKQNPTSNIYLEMLQNKILIGKYEEEKTPIIPEEKFLDLDLALDRKLDKINAPEIELETRASTRHVFTTEPPSTVEYSAVQTEAPHQSYGSSHAGLIIGILLTIISLLIGAILYVVYQVCKIHVI